MLYLRHRKKDKNFKGVMKMTVERLERWLDKRGFTLSTKVYSNNIKSYKYTVKGQDQEVVGYFNSLAEIKEFIEYNR
jgi:hypothetical protein